MNELTLTTILTFGKYKGKSCLEVIQLDLHYANWLWKNYDVDFSMAEQIGIRNELSVGGFRHNMTEEFKEWEEQK